MSAGRMSFEALLRVGRISTAVLGLTTAVLVVRAAEPDDDADDEREYRAAVARRLVEENCLICHSREMIETQRLTPAQWKAEVEKMVGWGSPLPKEHEAALIVYLSEQYPDTKAPPTLARMSPATLREPTRAAAVSLESNQDRAATLFATHCANCHGADSQGSDLGPIPCRKAGARRPDGLRARCEPRARADAGDGEPAVGARSRGLARLATVAEVSVYRAALMG